MRRSRRPVRCMIALALLLPIAGVAASVSAGARAEPSVKISPTKGLIDFSGDGQFVNVSWKGFPAKSGIYLRECERGATDIDSQCSQGHLYSTCGAACPGVMYLGGSDGSGSGRGIGQVAVGDINVLQNLDPVPGETFTCDHEHLCSLFVLPEPFDLSSGKEIPITFAPPRSACPEGGSTLSGSGGSAAFKLFLGWASTVCEPPKSIGLDYVLRSSTGAIDDYTQGLSSYAATPIPLDETQVTALEEAGRTGAYAPVAASSLVFAYRMMDQKSQSPVTDLVLTPELLAKIFTGQIVSWGDSEIRKLNPKAALPPQIVAVGRGDASEETLTMTRWMWMNARDTWIAGGANSGAPTNPFEVGPVDILPSLGQVFLVTGANEEASLVGRGGTDFTSFSTYGLIGYMDASYADQFKLSTVRIRFDDGKTVQATPATVRKAIEQMEPDDCGTLQPDVRIQDPTIWPMPTISYALIPHGGKQSEAPPDPETASALAALLRWGVGDGQKQLPNGYLPLPGPLARQTTELAKTIETGKPGHPEACTWEYEDPPPKKHEESDPPIHRGGTIPPGEVPPGPKGPGGEPPEGPPADRDAPTQEILVPPQRPDMLLAASGARAILPAIALLGLLALLTGTALLHAERFGAVRTWGAAHLHLPLRGRLRLRPGVRTRPAGTQVQVP